MGYTYKTILFMGFINQHHVSPYIVVVYRQIEQSHGTRSRTQHPSQARKPNSVTERLRYI